MLLCCFQDGDDICPLGTSGKLNSLGGSSFERSTKDPGTTFLELLQRKNTCKSILKVSRILTKEKIIRLYNENVQRELKMWKDMPESVWITSRFGRGLRVAAHWSTARMVNALL